MTLEGQSKEWVNISESAFSSVTRMKIGLQLVKYTPFFLNKWKVEN